MKNLLITLLFCSINFAANATLLTIEVEDKPYAIGDELLANIMVSDIEGAGPGFQKEVAGFDFDLLFSNSSLDNATVSYGNSLDLGLGLSVQLDFLGVGVASIAESSLVDPLLLGAEQMFTSEFLLASVRFDVTALGTVDFALDRISLTDGTSTSFSNISFEGTSVELGDATQVPLPASVLLMCLPLLAVIRKYRFN